MIVIDASATAPLLLNDETPPPLDIAQQLLAGPLVAPAHWPIEVASLLLKAQRGHRIDAAERRDAGEQAQAMRVWIATDTGDHVWTGATALAVDHRLTIYDAIYLEQAIRLDASLASLDDDLVRAARRSGVTVLTWIQA